MGVFNEPVMKEHWNMKKKTKMAWRYTKHILSYLIPWKIVVYKFIVYFTDFNKKLKQFICFIEMKNL